MMLISFAKTKDQFRRGTKSVTRRKWADSHRKKFHKGDEVRAMTAIPIAGGRPLGTIRLTADPYIERIGDMPAEDVALEGFPGMTKMEFIEDIWMKKLGGSIDDEVTVVRFRIETLYLLLNPGDGEPGLYQIALDHVPTVGERFRTEQSSPLSAYIATKIDNVGGHDLIYAQRLPATEAEAVAYPLRVDGE